MLDNLSILSSLTFTIPTFGSTGPMKRAGQPYEIAAIYVYLASNDSTYTTGQVIHVNGGEYKG